MLSRTRLGRALVLAGLPAVLALGALPASAASTVSQNPDPTPGADGRVDAFASNGSRLFVGGNFSHVGGQAHRSLAAVSGTSVVGTFKANVAGTVKALAVSPGGGTLYIGGSFTSVNGVIRANAAAVNAATGAVLAWNPRPTGGSVESIVTDGTRVYLGGTFGQAAGTTRGHLVAVSAGGTGSRVTSFNAHPDNWVFSLALSGGRLYLGGIFKSIDGASRPHLASITSAGSVTSWHPKATAPILDLAVSGSQLYAALAGGKSNGNGVAAFSTSASGAPAWIRQGDGNAQAVDVLNGVVYVGGHFSVLAGATRHHAAAYTTGGALLPWAPTVNSTLGVWALHTVGSSVWIGGDFTKVNSAARPHLARFS